MMGGRLHGTRLISGPSGTSRRSAPLELTAASPRDRLIIARLLAGDVLSSFGLPEPQQVTSDGRLVRLRFNNNWQQWLQSWAADAGVDVIENYD